MLSAIILLVASILGAAINIEQLVSLLPALELASNNCQKRQIRELKKRVKRRGINLLFNLICIVIAMIDLCGGWLIFVEGFRL